MDTPGDVDESAEATAYCPNCGRGVEPGDSYCGKCGHDLTDSGTDREESLRQFRARVSDYVANGWDIQYDAGDEVGLVDREYGSVPVHILLVLFTGGIGNIVYGWYHYEHSAEQQVLRAQEYDGTGTAGRGRAVTDRDLGVESDDGSLSGYVYGLLSIVFAVAVATSMGLSPVGVTLTLAALSLAALLLPPTRRRLANRHPPTTFGPTTSVDERFVESTDKPCSVCFDRVERGVKREYEQSYVVAGVPLYSIERGENWYCESCRNESSVSDTGSLDSQLDAITEVSGTAGTTDESVSTDRADGTSNGATAGDRTETTSLEDET